jgi:WD40 repeat protein
MAGDRGGVIRTWQLPSSAKPSRGGRKGPWNAHQGRVFRLAASPDGRQLVSCGEDGSVRCWSTDEPEQRRLLDDSRQVDVHAMVHDPVSNSLWTIGNQGLFRWPLDRSLDAAKPDLVEAGPFQDACLAIEPKGRRIALGDQSGRVRILHADTQAEVARWQLPAGADAERLMFIRQGRQVAVNSFEVDEWIFLYDLRGELVRKLPTLPYCEVVATSPDGRWLANNVLNEIQLWNLADGELRFQLPGHDNSITGLAFSPDGRWLASASRDRSLRIWHVSDGRPAAVLTGHRADVTSLAFAADGRSLASGDAAGSLRIWHVGAWQELAELDRAEGPIKQILFSRRNELLAYLAEGEGVALLSVRHD